VRVQAIEDPAAKFLWGSGPWTLTGSAYVSGIILLSPPVFWQAFANWTSVDHCCHLD